jgi:hypothetical protein
MENRAVLNHKDLMVGAAGLEPATLGLEGSAACFMVFIRNHIFHSLTPIPGVCFRSK